jgi:energy-coupling factor transport system ATP-binding protein
MIASCAMGAGEPLIRLIDVSCAYPESRDPALSGIRCELGAGEWLWIAGGGGSGKTTLVRLLCGLFRHWPGMRIGGSLLFEGREMLHASPRDWAGHLGVVFQDAAAGLTQEWVEDELAFGPENLGLPPAEIDRRLCEAERFLAVPGIMARRIGELSGGQQQRVAIASILTMRPRIWLLDDPAASLDAEAAARLTDTVAALHRQGHAICWFASRLDPRARPDRLLILDGGRLIADEPYAAALERHRDALVRLGCLPPEAPPARPGGSPSVAAATGAPSPGRSSPGGALPAASGAWPPAASVGSPSGDSPPSGDVPPVLQVSALTYRYETGADAPVLRGVNVTLAAGELLVVTGPNGSGKTTFGKLAAGLLPAPRGAIRIGGRPVEDMAERDWARAVGYVFQNPEHQFVASTVLEECVFTLLMLEGREPGPRGIADLGEAWLARFGLAGKGGLHPLALSAADRRRLALAAATVARPRLLVLDEPTAGLDYASADRLLAACAAYAAEGNAVVLITHDAPLARRYAAKQLALPG